MLAYGQSYAMTCDPDDQLANQQGMNEHNWYCGDVHVRGEYPYFASACGRSWAWRSGWSRRTPRP